MTSKLQRRQWMAAAVFTAVLAACGGGSGGGGTAATDGASGGSGSTGDGSAGSGSSGGGGGSTGGGGSNPGGGAAISGAYRLEAQPDSTQAAQQQLTQLGAAGFAWVAPVGSYSAPTQFGQLYLNSNLRPGSTFEYVVTPQPDTLAGLMTQLNQRGQQGQAYKGPNIYDQTTVPIAIQSIFVKDSLKTATYTYENLPSTVNDSRTDLLAQLNAQGARGFRFRGTLGVGGEFTNLYVKDSTGPASYTYKSESLGAAFSPANGPALLQTLQQNAADGSVFLGGLVLRPGPDSETILLYERSANASGPVEYSIESVNASATLSDLLASINPKAAQGVFWQGDYSTADGAFHRIFIKGLDAPNPFAGTVYP